jgi:Holliday junction DNA helicase RuvB
MNNENLRPKSLKNFLGQDVIKKQLSVLLASCFKTGKPLDHILLTGQAGLGKTSLAQVIAHEMGVEIRILNGANLQKKQDVLSLVPTLREKTILFIDEIHRMSPVIEEILYPIMEDFRLDLILGQGKRTKVVPIYLEKFTVIGATTKPGFLSKPLRDRFGSHFLFTTYSLDEMNTLIEHNLQKLSLTIDQQSFSEISQRARRTPRILNHLLKRLKDYAISEEKVYLSAQDVLIVFDLLGIDANGLNRMDKQILSLLKYFYKKNPVGIETIAASLGENKRTLEDIYEPYLLSEGFLIRTSRGRLITEKGEMCCD